MLSRISVVLSLVLFVVMFDLNAAAQTVGEGTIAVSDSKLTAINLPNGARRIKDGFYPDEVSTVLSKLIEQGGERVRQGDSEALVFGGNYENAKGVQLVKKFENDLRNAGWEYELAAKEQGVTIFTLLREAPSRRALVGFFAPSKDAFIFAVTEMLPANENVSDVQNNVEDKNENSVNPLPVSISTNSSNLVGKWLKSGGSGGSRDAGGKTLYNSGNDVIFEFFADGRMMFINDKNTLSITQCKITEIMKIPGTYSLSGDTLTMNLGAGTSVGTDSCNAKGNFKKNLSGGETLTKKAVVKRMESIFRPDAPLILCLDGQKDDECYEKVIK